MHDTPLDLSLVIPVYNEEGNLIELWDELDAVLDAIKRPIAEQPRPEPLTTDVDATEIVRDSKLSPDELRPLTYEVIFVDDGSRDASRQILKELAEKHPQVRVIVFRRNQGQATAIAAGIDEARGTILMFMDSDRQNDPADIPRLLSAIDNGFDVVCGWRRDRKGSAVNRRLSTRIANWLMRRVGGVPVHDLGCTLKAVRRDITSDVKLYGDIHRFVPIYASAAGAAITELPVNHRARVSGLTKHGVKHTVQIVLDLITVKYLLTYFARPMHFFGAVALAFFAGSGVTTTLMVLNKVIYGVPMILSPLLLTSAMLFMIAISFILTGLLAEVQTRIYFQATSRDRRRY